MLSTPTILARDQCDRGANGAGALAALGIQLRSISLVQTTRAGKDHPARPAHIHTRWWISASHDAAALRSPPVGTIAATASGPSVRTIRCGVLPVQQKPHEVRGGDRLDLRLALDRVAVMRQQPALAPLGLGGAWRVAAAREPFRLQRQQGEVTSDTGTPGDRATATVVTGPRSPACQQSDRQLPWATPWRRIPEAPSLAPTSRRMNGVKLGNAFGGNPEAPLPLPRERKVGVRAAASAASRAVPASSASFSPSALARASSNVIPSQQSVVQLVGAVGFGPGFSLHALMVWDRGGRYRRRSRISQRRLPRLAFGPRAAHVRRRGTSGERFPAQTARASSTRARSRAPRRSPDGRATAPARRYPSLRAGSRRWSG